MKPEIDNYLQSIDMPKPKSANNNLSYCVQCSTVFETHWGYYNGMKETKHLDMPTYGLERKNCTDCREETK